MNEQIKHIQQDANKVASFVKFSEAALKEVATKYGIDASEQDTLMRRISESVLHAKSSDKIALAKQARLPVRNWYVEHGKDDMAEEVAEEFTSVLLEYASGLRVEA